MSIRTITNTKSLRRLAVGGLAAASVIGIFASPASAEDTRGDSGDTSTAKAECSHLFGKTYVCKVDVFGSTSEYVCVLNRGCIKQ